MCFNPRPQEKKEGWEEVIAKLANHQMQYQERNDASLKNLERQVGQIAKLISERQQGALPSNTETNPRENVQAITTRSGVQLPEITVTCPKGQTDKAPIKEEKIMQEPDPKDKTLIEEEPEPSTSKAPIPVKAYVSPIPFPQRLHKQKLDAQFGKFLEVFMKLHINILFADALAQMPSYAKFMKDILSNKRKLEEHETEIGIGRNQGHHCIITMADQSIKYPWGVIEDVLVKVDKIIFSVDFIILDMEEDHDIPIILGRSFLATNRVLIDVQEGQLILRVQDEKVTFNSLKASTIKEEDLEVEHMVHYLEATPSRSYKRAPNYEDLEKSSSPPLPSLQQAPIFDLKPLPSHLRYAYLGESSMLPVIIANSLNELDEEKLLQVLREHKGAIGWTIAGIKGISPSLCMHKIFMEDDFKPSVEYQRRLNPNMKEVVRAEVVKWLDADIIYPISDSAWVSPVQVVPKKGGVMVVENEDNELIRTRPMTGWRVCIDYRKLTKAIKNDHFPLPFIDQMFERLAGYSHYYFLDGYSGYNQIPISPEDQEKTTFTCPYGTFAYRRMPFGLCNAPATFQRCMMAIFSDMVEKCIEVFMDDFSVFGASFDGCLNNLEIVLKRCEETNLVLNLEKCHFMVQEGIILGHRISHKRIEVDKAKIQVIEKLPSPPSVKGIMSFLGHVEFYRRFIKDFLKITKPLCSLLEKNTPFDFSQECLHAFNTLKEKLITVPIIVALDWNLPFELMCDASDYAVGVVLGQRRNKILHVIYYASRTLTDAQLNYATTEKEMLAMVFAFDKFRSYLIGSKVIVYTDHSVLKYLLAKKDAKPRLIRWVLLLQEFDLEIYDKKGPKMLLPITCLDLSKLKRCWMGR
ncbi:uncharacterized protein LOC111406872 [Olea europaea var. sylvestris]|uniref:uncharacterized protein LOC111406872 n=1 Tax=Olea europaea var. sylvestris TaxID=158386 RepID=UPI000C1D277A|nr:uncharacterized protein LOC111406872 [Olea europaea var. sylvestris]